MAVGDYISEIQTSDRNTHPIGSSFWVSSETWNGKTNTEVENEIKVKFSNLTEITWSDLVDLRDNGHLIPGMQYRITDYTCTTSQANTRSAGHQFDIIVTADDASTLNEVARAVKHEGDTYFANSDLNTWKLWYCLDNDTTRFAWADATNGKGVIYRMIDEFNNDCPYDFKNIQFYRQWDEAKQLWSTISSDNTGISCYTFSSSSNGSTTSFTDQSLASSNNVYSNVIKEYVSSNRQTLNNICFFGNNFYFNSFGNNCYNNTFKNEYYNSNCSSNTFGNDCYGNTFRISYLSNCSSNTFGNGCCKNTFESYNFQNNIFGNRCQNNIFESYECQNNIFGNNCYSNTFGDYFQYNIFGNNCYSNTFGDNCRYNTFGNDCYRNTFGNGCWNSTFGNNCSYNTFGNNCNSNTFGNNCSSNTFGDYCSSNTFGNSCGSNTFGNNCYYNTFGNRCYSIKFASGYCQYNHFGDGCQYILFKGEETASDTQQVQNYNFAQGLQGTMTTDLTINGVRNRNFETKVEKDSNGNLKIFCLADLIYSGGDNPEPSYPYSTYFIGEI